jgi:hypothetical protein
LVRYRWFSSTLSRLGSDATVPSTTVTQPLPQPRYVHCLSTLFFIKNPTTLQVRPPLFCPVLHCPSRPLTACHLPRNSFRKSGSECECRLIQVVLTWWPTVAALGRNMRTAISLSLSAEMAHTTGFGSPKKSPHDHPSNAGSDFTKTSSLR